MDKYTRKKKEQLGMNPSTAAHRLRMDLLYKYAKDAGDMYCIQCKEEISREDFSIDHIEPWLDSVTPTELFFDLQNIGFSHLSCNISAARRPLKKYANKTERKAAERKRRWDAMTPEERKQDRRDRYTQYSC